MPAKDLFEYAVIRIVPRVEREEFVNAGVILYCPKQKFLQVRYTLDSTRIKALCPEADLDMIAANLRSFKSISDGAKDAGPIALMDAPSRFRWLTAVRSTVVQTSRTHSGLCPDAGKALERLFDQMVGQQDALQDLRI
jgi:hypothetical protein